MQKKKVVNCALSSYLELRYPYNTGCLAHVSVTPPFCIATCLLSAFLHSLPPCLPSAFFSSPPPPPPTYTRKCNRYTEPRRSREDRSKGHQSSARKPRDYPSHCFPVGNRGRQQASAHLAILGKSGHLGPHKVRRNRVRDQGGHGVPHRHRLEGDDSGRLSPCGAKKTAGLERWWEWWWW